MRRRENRPTLFFTNFNFWCNFEGFFNLNVKNISNLLFFIVLDMTDMLLTTVLFQYSLNCCLPATLISQRHFICSLLASLFVPKHIRSEQLSNNGLSNYPRKLSSGGAYR